MKLIFSLLLATAFFASVPIARSQDGDPNDLLDDLELNDDNYQTWRDHILPAEKELGWDQIPWLTTFKDGIIAADKEKKPLLLWTMNGHPLGCT